MKKKIIAFAFALMLAISINMGHSLYLTANQAINVNIANDPECICASHRVGGSCSGATTRFCQGSADCKDLCGNPEQELQ